MRAQRPRRARLRRRPREGRRQQKQSVVGGRPLPAHDARSRTLVCSRRTYYIDFRPFCCPRKISQDRQVGRVIFGQCDLLIYDCFVRFLATFFTFAEKYSPDCQILITFRGNVFNWQSHYSLIMEVLKISFTTKFTGLQREPCRQN